MWRESRRVIGVWGRLTSAEVQLLWLLHGEKINTTIIVALCVFTGRDRLFGQLKFLIRFHKELYGSWNAALICFPLPEMLLWYHFNAVYISFLLRDELSGNSAAVSDDFFIYILFIFACLQCNPASWGEDAVALQRIPMLMFLIQNIWICKWTHAFCLSNFEKTLSCLMKNVIINAAWSAIRITDEY